MKILFVCHGNICRSPMAEFVMRHLVEEAGLKHIEVASAALHTDEIGSDTHYGTKEVLRREGIPFSRRQARLLGAEELGDWDLIIGMDRANMRDLERLAHGKRLENMHMLLEFAGRDGEEVADPWYTRDFDATFRDVMQGCKALLSRLT